MKLIMGVLDVAYSLTENGKAKETTTGDVAEILEKNYAVMATFYVLKQETIAGYLAGSLSDAIQDRLRGHAIVDPTYGGAQKIEAAFRSFLSANEMGKLWQAATGTALSLAAARGINHRKKHPYAGKNRARPAFVDTGLYMRSFRAWFVK